MTEPTAEIDEFDERLRQRLYVALTEQRVIDSRRYGEPPYAPVTWADVDHLLAGGGDSPPEGTSA